MATTASGTAMVEVSIGELIDKITILEIKDARLGDPAKRANVQVEMDALRAVRDRVVPPSPDLDGIVAVLRVVNEALWDIEDEIRDCERRQDFGERFVALARSVYRRNDERAGLKRRINELCGSRLVEEKSYAAY